MKNKKHELTNRDISEQYRETVFHIMKHELLGELACWLIRQSPYDTPDISKAIEGYNEFLSKKLIE